MDTVVYANDVSKAFGPTLALNTVSVAVQRGEIFGVLGPNGAGKTTLIEVLVGLQRADTGVVSILGHAMPRGAEKVRRLIGVMPQAYNLPPLLRVSELLSIYELLYPDGEGADSLLDRIGLVQQRRTLISKLSAGQKQRLALALALVARPELLILDEPTTALDPQARRFVWDQVRHAREYGSTTLLTTHSMEEAQSLCDRVMIMDRGRTVDLGSPRELIAKHCPGYRVSIACAPSDRPALLKIWGDRVTWDEQNAAVVSAGEVADVVDALSRMEANNIDHAPSISSVEHNNLEDVYLSLTGRDLRN